MIINFDTDYLHLVNGDLKAAMMLQISKYKQVVADKTDKPSKFGNYWIMTVEDWKQLGFGGRRSQKSARQKLLAIGNDFWRERVWGWPSHCEFCLDLKKLDQLLVKIKNDD